MTDNVAIREEFDSLISGLRPKLHGYCARMTGSVIDGEDVVQEALLKAIEALPQTGPLTNPEGWLFSIAHNAALDFLRRRARYQAVHADEDLDMVVDPIDPVHDRQMATASLRTLMRLPVNQRSAVILKDVLGYSLHEVGEVIGADVPTVKPALQRGRMRLRALAQQQEGVVEPALAEPERSRLKNYVEHFNNRDFDTIRQMLAADVQLELINRLCAKGRDKVGNYFHRYSLVDDWHFVPGFVDTRPAILACDPHDLSGRPAYFILLNWDGDNLIGIKDFLFARYAIECAEISVMS